MTYLLVLESITTKVLVQDSDTESDYEEEILSDSDDNLDNDDKWFVIHMSELENAGSTGSAEPDFLKILRQICPVFCNFFTIFYQIFQFLPKFTKAYQIYQILANLNQVCNLRSFVTILIFFLFMHFFPKNLYPQKVGVVKKMAFFHLLHMFTYFLHFMVGLLKTRCELVWNLSFLFLVSHNYSPNHIIFQ